MTEENPYRPTRLENPDDLGDLSREHRKGPRRQIGWQSRLAFTGAFFCFGNLIAALSGSKVPYFWVISLIFAVVCMIWTAFAFVEE